MTKRQQDDSAEPDAINQASLEAVTEAPATADVIPFDRLPGNRFAAPRMSVYNTKRAQNARALAEQQDPEGVAAARNVLFEAGLRRSRTEVADTADHNAMTLASALRLSKLGFHVIDSHAIHPVTGEGTEAPDRDTGIRASHGKSPRGSQWEQRCTTDPEEIVSFWTGRGEFPPSVDGDVHSFSKPKAPRNVSICFPADCLMMALDSDGEEGAASIASLESKYGPLPKTVMQITGSGVGWHKFYRCRTPIYNSASGITDAPKVDVRGVNGQVIVAPSVHKTGGYYTWVIGCEPLDIAQIPFLPEAWEELIHANSKVEGSPKTRKAAAKKAKASKDSDAKPAEKKARRSYAEWLEFIGDDVGCGGFHGPIFGAARNYFVENGVAADQAELLHDLQARMAVAVRDPDKDRNKYGSERKLLEYIADAYDSAVQHVADKADEEAIDAEAVETARAFLRGHLVTEDGETRLTDEAARLANAHLTALGISDDDAADYVAEAVADVMRQLDARADDRETDPVADARIEVSEAVVPSILAPLYDERLVDDNGFMVTAKEHPGLYRAYKIKPKDADAHTLMSLVVRDQMFASLNARVSWVVLDGEAKWAIRAGDGEAARLWKEQTISKLFINRAVTWYLEEKPQTIKPSDVITFARQRATFLDTCFEPNPAKAERAAKRGQYNLWTGFAVRPVEGNWSKLRGHILDQLCGGDIDLFNWVMTWFASTFARPGVKVPSSIALIGEQGTGKSKVCDWIRRAIGCAALKVSAGRHLTGNFNAHLDGILFLTCEEAFWAGEKAAAGVLKDLVTSDTLQIEGKFANVVERPNYVNVCFISNNSWVIPTDGQDARRFLVLHCLATRKLDAVFFGAIDDQMEHGGVEAMVYELTNWKPEAVGLTWNSLRTPPVTESLRQQAGMGLHGPAARLVAILESGVLSGTLADKSVFYYDLDDDSETVVARSHLVSALYPDLSHGNMSGEAKAAIETFLGPGADGVDDKKVVTYEGTISYDCDARTSIKTKRVRYVTIPPVSSLKQTLALYGRG